MRLVGLLQLVGGQVPEAGTDPRMPWVSTCTLLCRQEGEGYTIQEACLLARSSVPQQRVLALRLLRSVLAHSRPSGAASGAALVPLPAAVAAQLQEEGRQGAAGVEWVALWHHALHAADVVLLLRRSLDDSHSAVAGAAAEALAALLGASGPAGAVEEAAAEMADASTLTGWPVPAMRHMQVGGQAMACEQRHYTFAVCMLVAAVTGSSDCMASSSVPEPFDSSHPPHSPPAAAHRERCLGGGPRLATAAPGCRRRGRQPGGGAERAAAGQSGPAVGCVRAGVLAGVLAGRLLQKGRR